MLALLPAGARARLEAFAKEAAAILGDELVALIVYGSAVRGGLTPRSDIDVVIVVEHDDAVKLRALHDAAAIARVSARLDLQVLVHDELAQAADVFPVLFDDLRSNHAVLVGTDVFKDLVIHHEHRRLRVEQELREQRMQLRRLLVDTASDDLALRLGIEQLVKRMRAPLSSLCVLHGVFDRATRVKDDIVTVLDVLGRRYALDTQPLTATPTTAQLAALDVAGCCLAVLSAAIADVDTLAGAAA
ncbi:MAG TPA: nucleotidyltransferase domain-containing protein [Myxococcota bacterium]